MAESIITNQRRINLRKITSGEVSTIPKITHIAFGNAGVDSGGDPITPSGAQTALNNEVARYPIDSVECPVTTTARYMVTIPKNDLVGVCISEAALVDESGALCAIQTMYEKRKDEGVKFVFTFDDEF